MTITPTATAATPIPALTPDVSWEEFASAITEAASDEQVRLLAEIPTPPLTADSGSDEWNNQYRAQQSAGNKRNERLNAFNISLVVAVAEALDAVVPHFSSLDVEYRGSGDSGEACDISVGVDTSFIKPTEMASWGHLIYSDEERKQVVALHEEAEALSSKYLEDLNDWLDETCWSIAYNQHPGFEINEGGWGHITVERNDAGEMKLSLDHTQMETTEYNTVVLN